MSFEQPLFAFLFFILPIIFILKNSRKNNKNAFVIPVVSTYIDNGKPLFLIKIYSILPYLIVAFLVVALMHPVLQNVQQTREYEANDVIIAIDCSQSMLFEDVRPNRFEIAKQTTIDFINKRQNDRIGAIGFAGECITIMPLIRNHSYLVDAIKKLHINTTEFNHINLGNGTAIGVAIATALLRLKDSEANTKIIILISDGSNNAGNILPEDAIATANHMNVKIYTIGIGSPNNYNNFNNGLPQLEYDAHLLTRMAEETQGKFFQANNKSDLVNIYKVIDELETTKFNEYITTNNYSIRNYFILATLFLIAITLTLKSSVLRYL